MTVSNAFTSRILVGIGGTLVGAVICLGAAASPAEARNAETPPTVSVSYADLDLARPAGRTQLDRRINHAAHLVCGTAITGSRIDTPAWRDCVRGAIASAAPRPRLDVATLATR